MFYLNDLLFSTHPHTFKVRICEQKRIFTCTNIQYSNLEINLISMRKNGDKHLGLYLLKEE